MYNPDYQDFNNVFWCQRSIIWIYTCFPFTILFCAKNINQVTEIEETSIYLINILHYITVKQYKWCCSIHIFFYLIYKMGFHRKNNKKAIEKYVCNKSSLMNIMLSNNLSKENISFRIIIINELVNKTVRYF